MQRIRSCKRSLCVSIHDVSSHAWTKCQVLIRALRAVASIPITLLVVPGYHRLPAINSSLFESTLENHLAGGGELALHGYTDLADGPTSVTWYGALLRQGYAKQEGEFASLEQDEAARRIELGLDWFAQRKWRVHAFVAPAWLLSGDAWGALAQLPLRYTTTTRGIYLRPEGPAMQARPMVYGARNAATRWLSMRNIDLLKVSQREAPLVRVGLHPADAGYPELVAHFQRLLKAIVPARGGITKIACAERVLEPCKPDRATQLSTV
jgi:predicted deacetylase